MAKAKGQNYIHGAVILTIGVVIMKILGFVYKVPIGNILGDDGNSMFMAAYNVYFVFFTLATSGLPIALSRMISEANAQQRPMQARRILRVAWISFFVIGFVFSAIMFLFPEQLADGILHNPDAAKSIYYMSPAVLLVCLVSAYRGYCQGYGNMVPTTVGQVLEVLVKVIVGLALAAWLVNRGMDKSTASAGAIFGVTAGSLAALVYMFIYMRRNYKLEAVAEPDVPDSDRAIFRKFVGIGVPIAVGSSIMAFLNLVDSSLCMGRLQSAANFTLNEAQVLYGVYGKAQTLFNLPAAFITPLTISIVPAIAGAIARHEDDSATKISEDSMRIAAVLALPMGVGLAVLSDPIMKVIYPGSHESGPALLAVMGAASFFVCIVLMENAILQASGKEKYPMYSMIAGSLVKIAVNWFLVANPKINIYGAPIGTLAGYAVMCIMNFVFMCFVLDKNPRVGAILARPLLCSGVMGAAAWAVYGIAGRLVGLTSRLTMAAAMAGAILAAVIVYLVLIIALRAVTKEDLELIPGGNKIAKVLHVH